MITAVLTGSAILMAAMAVHHYRAGDTSQTAVNAVLCLVWIGLTLFYRRVRAAEVARHRAGRKDGGPR